MTAYDAPLPDMLFVLRHIIGGERLKTLPGCETLPDLLEPVLEEAGRLASEVLAPLNAPGDRQGARLEGGAVRTASGWKEAYAAFTAGGWNGVPFSPEWGGQGLPWCVTFAVQEMVQAANMAFGLCPMLNQGAVEAVLNHGTQEQKAAYVPNLISGRWTGTMNLTEAQAGSDLGAIATRARKDSEGVYRITGQKIFITYGDHDLTENIVHLVLARVEGAPAGVRGISLFIVPKVLEDGTRNDVTCVALEHKLGIHASPTCTMSYGERGGALGYLVGRENEGLRCMFTMMNNARLSVGLQGVGIAERATQAARAYAAQRMQGGHAIESYPDVRRMLLTMQAYVQAGRCMAYEAAFALDAGAQALVDLYTPIVKGWCTDRAVDVTSLGVQVLGGAGFIEEAGVAQYYRDARILPIYEGTNGVQAMDLVTRKICKDKAAAMGAWIESQKPILAELDSSHGYDMSMTGETLSWAFDALKGATGCLIAMGEAGESEALGAVSHAYLTLAGHVMGGAALARGALAARELLRTGDTAEFSPDFLQEQIMLARFFADHILSHTSGYARTVRTGAPSVLRTNQQDEA